MAINTQKLVPSSFGSQQVSQKKLIEVKRSVIDVEKLMTGIVAFEKKQQDAQRKSTEEKRYQKRENDLERKTIKKQFKLNLPSLPRMGFFDWIKNFVTNTLLGFFAVRLLKYVPKLIGVAGLALNAAEGILNFAGGLLNGAATFIEWGYKAYDATRGFLKQIGGDNVTKLFDKFLSGLDLFLTLSLGATVVNLVPKLLGKGTRGVIGGGITAGKVGSVLSPEKIQEYLSRFRPKLAATQQRNAQQIPEKVMRSATGRVPMSRPKKVSNPSQTLRTTPLAAGDVFEDFARQEARLVRRLKNTTDPQQIKNIQSRLSEINISRRTSAVATSEGVILSRGIDPQKQTVEQFYEKKVQSKSKVIPSPTKPSVPASSVAQSVGKKTLLGQVRGLFRAVRLPLIAGLIDFGISWALGEDPGRAAFRAIGATLLGGILGAVGSVIPIAGTFIGGLVGGTAGDMIGGVLYDIIFGNKKPQTPKQNPQGFASGGEVGRGPRKQVRKKRKYLTEPTQTPIAVGKDVDSEKFNKRFDQESKNYFESGFNILSGTDFFGPLFGIAIKSFTGDKPTSADYRTASFGLSNWMTSTFGNVAMQGFANGGLVGGGIFLDSRQIQSTIESSLESRITSEVDQALQELKKNLGIEDKKDKEKGRGTATGKSNYNEKPTGSFSGTGGEMIRSEEATKLAGDLGRFIESKLVSAAQAGGGYTDGDYLRITEHPDYGGSFTRDYKSWHNVDRAIDIGAFAHEQQKILDVIEEFNKMRGVTPVELLHAGNDPSGDHNDHVHVAYFGGGLTGKGGLIRTHPGEYVIDKDSVDLYSIPFFNIINQTENESQRKQNSLRLMSILQSYAGYESGFEQTVTVPVPMPQMIPIPVPMQSSESMIMSGGGGSSGRASDILESIG